MMDPNWTPYYLTADRCELRQEMTTRLEEPIHRSMESMRSGETGYGDFFLFLLGSLYTSGLCV